MSEQLLATPQAMPHFGYRRMAARLSLGGSRPRPMRHMRVNIPCRGQRRRRSGSDIRLPDAVRPNAAWCYELVHDLLVNGRSLKLLACVQAEYTRECLAIELGARPWRRVHGCQVHAQAARSGPSGRPSSHRQPLAERLRGKLQRQSARQTAEQRVVLIERCRTFYNKQRPHRAHHNQPLAKIRRNWIEPATIEPRLTA